MPELVATKTIKRNARKAGVNWNKLSYSEMINEVARLAGPKPDIPRDLPTVEWSSQAIQVLKERYFLKDKDGNPIESVSEMCWRVAWELARAEVKFGKSRQEVIAYARTYYTIMMKRDFLPNSPTLMNAGKGNGLQYSACYVIPVEDSLQGIFDGIKYQAIVHQSGGGTGFSFSRLRPAGSRVKSTMGVASGPVSFMKVYNEATQQIKQGGMRRGANMGILRIDHPDVMEFIHCKDDNVSITNFNISVTATDKFFEALAKDEEYELMNPQNGEVAGKLKAKEVWDQIAAGAWKSGDPGMIFIDRINQSPANPIRKDGWEVESTNPCVTGDTLISTAEGLVRMKEVVESHFPGGKRHGGNMALMIDKRTVEPLGDKGMIKGQAYNFYELEVKDVYKLTTKSGFELKATPDHRVLTPHGWSQIKNLKVGEDILIQSGAGEFGKVKNLPFAVSKNTFPSEWSLELGRVLGWLIGDGWLKSGDKNCRVGFTFGIDDNELMKYFTPIINKWYGKDIRPIKRVRNTWHLSYHSKYFVDFFMNLGVKNVKAGQKQIPELLYTAPKEAAIGFLQGLFSADGTVRDSKKSNSDWIALTSKSEKLLHGVQLLLLNLGIKSRIFNRGRKVRTGMFAYTTKDGNKKTYTLDGILYELGIFGDFREKFKKEIGFLNSKQDRLANNRLRKNIAHIDKFVDKVVSVEYFGKEKVYDLTEIVSHTMITNGIIVHQCGEQPLYPFDACNLGSIFLKYFVKEGDKGNEVDWDKLKTTVHTAVRMLDSVIEMNPFPLSQISDTVHKIRRIGLGVGGWADMLIRLGIPYDSDEAITLAEKVMKFINEEGHKESRDLAKERGAFPLVKDSIYKSAPMRNSTVTTIAPTGTIGILANNFSGIEPMFAIAYQHIVKSENRTLTFIDPYFEEVAKKRGFYSEELMRRVVEHGTIRQIDEIPEDVRKVFGTAHEIAPAWHVRMQAAFQKYTDNAVSKTINLSNSATVDDIKAAYKLAWDTGCRGITVFRDGCKSEQVLNLGVKNNKKKVEEPKVVTIKPRPTKVEGATYKIATPMGHAFITVNQDADGNPFEVFIAIGRAGSEVAAMAEALGRLISTTLRFGNHTTSLERAKDLVDQLKGIGGGGSVGFGPNKVRSLPDAVAKAISMHFGLLNSHADDVKEEVSEKEKKIEPLQMSLTSPQVKKDLCPSCGNATLVYEEGCKKCHGCGYSEC